MRCSDRLATMPACPCISLFASDATDNREKTFRMISSESECLARVLFLLEGFPPRQSGSLNSQVWAIDNGSARESEVCPTPHL